jgi:enamine deaminase RidA (YjgF/YER057c/UK114 family)
VSSEADDTREPAVVEWIDPPELGRSPGYSYAVVAQGARTVYTAGAVPLDESGALVGAGDLAAQAEKTVGNLLLALQAAGAGVADIVKTSVFVVASRREMLGRAWRCLESSGLTRPPSTLLGVTFLGYEGQMIEIEAIAVLR